MPDGVQVVRLPMPQLTLRLYALLVLLAAAAVRAAEASAPAPLQHIGVLYAYHEASAYYEDNLRFFIHHALSPAEGASSGVEVHAVIVVNGDECSPCRDVSPTPPPPEGFLRAR